MNWAADLVQAVIFSPPTGETQDALQPWLRLFSSSPQSFMSGDQATPGASVAGGVVGDFNVQIAAQPGRLEIVLRAPERAGEPARISAIKHAVNSATAYAKQLSKSNHTVLRIAVVASLSKTFSNKSEAQKAFFSETGIVGLPQGSSDLQFGLNSPKDFQSDKITLNRLLRWMTVDNQILELKLAQGSSAPSLNVKDIPTLNWLVDVNTAIGILLDQDRIADYFDMAVDEFNQLLEGGYGYIRAK